MKEISIDVVKRLIELKENNILDEEDWHRLDHVCNSLEYEETVIKVLDFLESEKVFKKAFLKAFDNFDIFVDKKVSILLDNQDKDFFEDSRKTALFFNSAFRGGRNDVERTLKLAEFDVFFENEEFRKKCRSIINNSSSHFSETNFNNLCDAYSKNKDRDSHIKEALKDLLFIEVDGNNKELIEDYINLISSVEKIKADSNKREFINSIMANISAEEFKDISSAILRLDKIGEFDNFYNYFSEYSPYVCQHSANEINLASKFYSKLKSNSDLDMEINSDYLNQLFSVSIDSDVISSYSELVGLDLDSDSEFDNLDIGLIKLVNMNSRKEKFIENNVICSYMNNDFKQEFMDVGFIDELATMDELELLSYFSNLKNQKNKDKGNELVFDSNIIFNIGVNDKTFLSEVKEIVEGSRVEYDLTSKFVKIKD